MISFQRDYSSLYLTTEVKITSCGGIFVSLYTSRDLVKHKFFIDAFRVNFLPKSAMLEFINSIMGRTS